MIDFYATHTDSKHLYRNSPSGPESRPTRQDAIDESIHGQIKGLIPRLRRYALAVVLDPVAADDLVQDCLARALGKIHLWEEGTDLRACYSQSYIINISAWRAGGTTARHHRIAET